MIGLVRYGFLGYTEANIALSLLLPHGGDGGAVRGQPAAVQPRLQAAGLSAGMCRRRTVSGRAGRSSAPACRPRRSSATSSRRSRRARTPAVVLPAARCGSSSASPRGLVGQESSANSRSRVPVPDAVVRRAALPTMSFLHIPRHVSTPPSSHFSSIVRPATPTPSPLPPLPFTPSSRPIFSSPSLSPSPPQLHPVDVFVSAGVFAPPVHARRVHARVVVSGDH